MNDLENGPEDQELSDDDFNEMDEALIDELLADESHSIIDWPTPILVYPVQLSAPEYTDEKLIALARQRLAMEPV